jgi:hypothetical protein
MGTRLRVTALEVRDHPDAVVRANPIAEVVILARTEPILRKRMRQPTSGKAHFRGKLPAR